MIALLLSLFALTATAAEIEVSGILPVHIVKVDGKRVMPAPGTATITKRRLQGGTYTVTVESAIGKELASYQVTVEPDRGVRLKYSKKALSLYTKYIVDPPKEGGVLGKTNEVDPDAITVTKKGGTSLYAWLDGKPQGKVKGKGLTLAVDSGSHEVWVARDEEGIWTFCYGLADKGSTVALSNKGCEGLADGSSDSSFAKGAVASYKQAAGVGGYVSIDGGRAFRAGAGKRELNLSPGPHTFVLSAEPAATNIYAQHTFDLAGDETVNSLTCSTAGCLGFKEPATPFTVVSVEPPTSDAGSSGGDSAGSGGDYCCVNDAYYECPNAKEAYDCTGEFMACMLDCDITDPSCIETCDRDHPIDPSGCDRAPSRDGECG